MCAVFLVLYSDCQHVKTQIKLWQGPYSVTILSHVLGPVESVWISAERLRNADNAPLQSTTVHAAGQGGGGN